VDRKTATKKNKAATARVDNPYAKTATEKNRDAAAAAKVDNPYAMMKNETQE
jgi:hypothetical protein